MDNAALLRAGAVDQADLANIAEELEDLAKSQKRELISRIRIVLLRLIKLKHSSNPSERLLSSWTSTLGTQRFELEQLLEMNPSLAGTVGDVISRAYPRARKLAADQIKLPVETFPEVPGYTIEQVLGDYFPKH